MTHKTNKTFRVSDRLSNCLWLWMFVHAAIASPNLVAAQGIDTNRPGFSFSPGIVPLGRWQLETGVSYTRFDSNTRTTSLPTAELRFGVADQVEVFLSSLSWSRTESRGGDASGLVDAALGAKVNFSSAEAKTKMALLFQLSAPVGDNSYTSDSWDPGLAFIWSHEGHVPIAGTVKLTKFDSGYQLDCGLKLPFSLGEARSAFVEWEANLPEGAGSAHWLNGGYQWLLEKRMQIDVNAGLGLNDRAGDFRLGVGFSIGL